MDADVKKGIYYMLFASFLFAFMGAFAKELSNSMSSVEVVFFRNLFGVIAIGYILYKSPIKHIGGKPFLLFFRGFIGFCALLMFFYNIANISLAEAMTFSKTSPIFTAILAYFILKEKLNFYAWCGVFIGFVGIMFITSFNPLTLSKTDWLGILSGLGAAMAYTSIRELKNYYDTKAIVFSFMAVGTVGPLILMLIGNFYHSSFWDFAIAPFVMPSGMDWVYIGLLGLFSTYAQVYMTKAYSSTKAGIIGTISYTNIIFSIILGMFLGDSFPSFMVSFGIVLIILSGVLVATNSSIKS
ncbi:DMT family transporter [Arcobacter sp. FWKO B]|uniref:DMT family transporter n=1 Tax=Arcobacter sp. FWKO B TaxID=2593672 RepID=UPI0018A4FE1F|nr:DMT family transporter [Arcobacter sp. FWKO B]QOG11191.1 DMT family transporter [Arcobacter sp. FWKO B]